MAFFFGVIVPYMALALFLGGILWRVVDWAGSPVPFPIATTTGQQRSLPWFRHARLDNPSSPWGVMGRIALEVLCFRSLMRNTRAELRDGPTLTYHWEKWLWVGALAFHWSLLIILVRHLRLALQPIPGFVLWLEQLDSLFRIGLPTLYLTDLAVVAALTYLLVRRLIIPQVRYISLSADYLLPLLILSVAVSGILMRHLFRVDIISVKALALGLATFRPQVPDGIGLIFFVHLFLVSLLVAYIPFSKAVHLAGVFLAPTRLLQGNSRAFRHINPWNAEVKVHTYHEYEEEYRAKMLAAGIPVEEEGDRSHGTLHENA